MKWLIGLVLFLPLLTYSQSPGSEEAKMNARNKLQEIRTKVLAGESFGLLAAQYSEDPGSASKGGVYNAIKKGRMVAEFEDAAFSLKQGEVSEIFETQYGFHFLQVMARRGDEVDVRHILIIPK
jgi:peptidyl-prolyl cis-trans isomerase SurA